MKDKSTKGMKGNRETLSYENRDYEIYAKGFDEDGVENFLNEYIRLAKRDNPKDRITLEKSIEIQKEKLPKSMEKGHLFTIGAVLQGGELLIHDQFWVFEGKDKKYTIARV